MLRYLFRRLLFTLPTLWIVSMLIFGLGKCSSIYDERLETTVAQSENSKVNFNSRELALRQAAAELRTDKPVFYCSLTTAAYPDTLYRIWLPSERDRLSKLIAETGNWPAVQRFRDASRQALSALVELPDTFAQLPVLRIAMDQISKSSTLAELTARTEKLTELRRQWVSMPPPLGAILDTLQNASSELQTHLRPEQMLRPAFYWYGLNNQYHDWISGFVTGNFGRDKNDMLVAQIIRQPLFTTLSINGLAMILAYLIAIPLGVYMARWRGGTFDRWAQRSLLLLYAMPAFWLGMLLILVFGIPANQSWQVLSGQSFPRWFFQNFPSFILPLATLTLHALAVLAFQMRAGMLDTLEQDFIRTARAKGLDEDTVYWRHAFRNALFPVITVFGSIFPAVFSGSVVVELLFHFEGIGQLIQRTLSGNNHPVLFVLLMFAAAFTMLGNLMADLLYAWADPRVRYARKIG